MLRKILLLFFCLVLIGGLAGAGLGWMQYQTLHQPLALSEEQMVEVPAGSTPSGVLQRLEQQGIVHNALLLRLYWRFKLESPALHSGEYLLKPGQTGLDLLDMWRRGDVVQYSVTLVEGWTFRKFRAALGRQEKLGQTIADLSDSEIMAQLEAKELHPEGQFFPDTYRYVSGMTDMDILRKAHERLKKVFDEEWAQRQEGLPYGDEPYKALIMASLIEKETGVPHEREEIAGVFVRRMKIGMRLQTDPTVIYGLGERYNGRITRAHLREETPYNTYVIDGIPPTPIAMVGREAIHAALHPAEGDTLYFVARGDGSHVFSRSLQEHNRAVREYQLNRRADYRSSPAPINREDSE